MIRRVVCVGECMVELRRDGAGRFAQSFGGDSLNAAVYLARELAGADWRVAYATALGDDPFSDEMLAAWAGEGIETDPVLRAPGRVPGLYVIETDEAGERRFLYWRSAAPAREAFEIDGAERLRERLVAADWLLVTGISLAILTATSRARLIETVDAARTRGAKLAYDSNYRPGLWPSATTAREVHEAMLSRTDLALLTHDDEADLFGDASAEATVARTRERHGTPEIAVKRGAEPCLVATDGAPVAVEGPKVERVIDTTAAGDSFNAGYLAARLTGRDPVEAAKAGHRLAARVIQHRGAIAPRTES